LRQKISEALDKLEGLLVSTTCIKFDPFLVTFFFIVYCFPLTQLVLTQAEEAQRGSESNVELINKAKDAIAKAKTAIRSS